MRVSIADVAKRANVSISTVSRVLNRRDLVNAETRRRVDRAIEELGYRPNMFARGLMLRKSEMVGLMLPDLHGEFYSEIIRGANAKARELGYHLVILSASGASDVKSLLLDLNRRCIVDGLAIMLSEQGEQVATVDSAVHMPLAVLDGRLDHPRCDSVTIDQRAGALALMRHLVHECGMRRVVFVGGLMTNLDTQARRLAWAEVLRESDLPVLEDDVHYLDYQYDSAYTLARRCIGDWAGPGHCVFAANDEMASAVIDAAAERRLRVPGDLAVVGFDDTRVARMTRPPLTTVRVPMSQMGAAAVELLCQRLEEPDRSPTHVSLTPKLVIRASCGADRREG
jgi:DNA-binding LacI/PurR family transcriptional regulator